MNVERIAELLDVVREEPVRSVDLRTTRDDTIILANELAWESSRNQALRGLAAEITSDVGNVPLDGPEVLARWVRDHVLYTQETPYVEILQGPVSCLRNMTGDCDDLVILWVALCASIGLPAYLVGVGKRGATRRNPEDHHWYVHAIGYAPDSELELIEVTDDARYGGGGYAVDQPYLPPGSFLVYYDPEIGQLEDLETTAETPVGPTPGATFPWAPVALGALLLYAVSR